jgi:hypothetical protein
MKVKDAGELIFTCAQDEEGALSMTCANTLCEINCDFEPSVPNNLVTDSNSGVISFTVERDTDLIIIFHYTGQVGGKYECELRDVDDFPGGVFPDTVKQFGPLPQRRTYSFLIEDN